MKWVNEFPKIDGVYWLRRKNVETRIVSIWDIGTGLNRYEAMISYMGTDQGESLCDVLKTECKWFGPLIPPIFSKEILCE